MYPWFVVLHLLGLMAFLLSHAVSMWVAFRIRDERDRTVLTALLGLSARGSQAMYVGLIALAVGGFGAAAIAGVLLAPWIVVSYAVLVGVLVAMYAIAGSYYYALRDGLAGTDKVPRLDDEALAARLRSRRPEFLAGIGGGGLAILVVLMSVKPALW